MQELEKIIEEINETIERYGKNPYITDDITDLCYGMNIVKDIIRKHMKNDGWIPVEERLPKDDTEVLITYADIDDEKYTDIAITTYGDVTLGGYDLGYKNWRSPFMYFSSNFKVLAWRPLPESYKPERSNE